MANIIDKFDGDYNFLSNFYPCNVKFESHFYDSSEHAYQAAKSLDESIRRQFRGNITASAAKRLGKKIRLRKDWESVKLQIMEQVVLDKFTRNKDLQERLFATGDADLIEGNHWGDTFWGTCNGRGQNHLGRILMKVRTRLR